MEDKKVTDIERRRKVLRVSAPLVLQSFFKGRIFEPGDYVTVTSTELPEDVLVCGIYERDYGHYFAIVLQSEKFDPVPDGEEYPEFKIEWNRHKVSYKVEI